ncbi:MAG: glycosyltransferase [Actinomycetota bacterium]|nr:glycosyltransferase [Actinomycetota bacterium]
MAPRDPGLTVPGADILVVSVDSTGGWTAAARDLAAAFSRAGAEVRSVSTGPVPQVRTFALTDFVQARLARQACRRGLAEHRPAAIVYCSITATLLWPAPGAIWLDTIAAENRPGRHGVWQRIVERRRLAQAPLVLTMSPRSLEPLRGTRPDAVVVPSPVERSAGTLAPLPARDVTVLTYAGNPAKKRLDFILSAWSRVRRSEEQLVVAGTDRGESADGVQMAGRLDPAEYRALLRRARVFVAAPTREDYGIAPLEALADGCLLVTTPAPGPYPALDLARELDPRLVDEDIGRALRTALDDPLPGYAERARELLAPFRPAAVDRTLAERVLPVLVPGLRAA